MKIEESSLFKHLIQIRSWVNNFRDSYDIYHFITGYYKALILPEVKMDFEQKWIYDLSYFIEKELKEKYFEKQIGGHWGNLIYDSVDQNNDASIELFYKLLDEFESKYKVEIVKGKLKSNIQRYNS